MKLFTQYDYAKLLENGKPENRNNDHLPVVKLFTPDSDCIVLLTQLIDLDIAFGLCDLADGSPELVHLMIPEIVELRGPSGLPFERDRHFKPKFPISVYANAACFHRRIVEDEKILERFA